MGTVTFGEGFGTTLPGMALIKRHKGSGPKGWIEAKVKEPSRLHSQGQRDPQGQRHAPQVQSPQG